MYLNTRWHFHPIFLINIFTAPPIGASPWHGWKVIKLRCPRPWKRGEFSEMCRSVSFSEHVDGLTCGNSVGFGFESGVVMHNDFYCFNFVLWNMLAFQRVHLAKHIGYRAWKIVRSLEKKHCEVLRTPVFPAERSIELSSAKSWKGFCPSIIFLCDTAWEHEKMAFDPCKQTNAESNLLQYQEPINQRRG